MDKSEPKKNRAAKVVADISQILKSGRARAAGTGKEPAGTLESTLKWKNLAVMALTLVVLSFICYANSIFMHPVFGDQSTLSFLRGVQNWDNFWDQLWRSMFLSPLTQQWLKATYAWDYQAAGNGWWWFHTVNIGLHAVSCLYFFALIFRLCLRLKLQKRISQDPYYLAFAAAALFACHPLAAEGVAYISGREAPLLAANYFLSLNCFLLGYLGAGFAARFWGYGLAALFLWNAILVNPGALTLPVTMLALTMIVKDPATPWIEWATKHLIVLAALILVAGTLPYLALKGMTFQAANGVGVGTLPADSFYPTQLKAVLTYYLRCFIVPAGMAVDPPWVLAYGWSEPLVIAGALVVTGCLAGMWLWRRNAIICLSLFLFLVGFIPGSLIAQPEVVSDHRFYLSLSGLCLISGYAFACAAGKSLKGAGIAFGAVLLGLVGLTIWRNTAWSSDEALWSSTLRVNPGSGRAHAMLALDLLRRDKINQAASEAILAIHQDPRSAPAFVAVGGALLTGKDYKGATEAFKHALDLAQKENLSDELVHTCQTGLAESLLDEGDVARALPVAEQAIQTDPFDPVVRVLAGKCLLALGKADRALAELEMAASLDSHLATIWAPLVEAALQMGSPAVAYQAAQTLVRIDSSPESSVLLAQAAGATGRYAEAIAALEPLAKKQSRKALVYALLSLAEAKLGQKDKAEDYREQALALDRQIFSRTDKPPGSSTTAPTRP